MSPQLLLSPALVLGLGAMLATSLPLAGSATALAAQGTENPFTESADVMIGRRMFLRYCGRCHGDNAKGGIGLDLTTGRFRHGGSDETLFRVISEGVSGTEMIPVLRNRSDQAIWQVITFLRSLSTSMDVDSPAAQPQVSSCSPAGAIARAAIWLQGWGDGSDRTCPRSAASARRKS